MSYKSSINTIFSRSSILLINFLIVIFTTQIWKSDGRGEIALVMLNISIIIIVNNIFSGSTVAFHTQKTKKNELLLIAFLGSFIISIIGAILFSLHNNFNNFTHFFVISFFNSLANTFTLYFLGKNDIKKYNIFLALPPIAIFFFLIILYYLFNITSINSYFYANYFAYGAIILAGILLLNKNEPFIITKIQLPIVKKISYYGFNSEVSNLFQFLNYRLTFYFIAEFLGYHELGVFSVAVAISEALWIVSKSTSSIHYSYVINSANENENIKRTSLLVRQNFFIGIIFSTTIWFIPNEIFTFIFGDSFNEVKTIVIYLIPGIIAIASSNIIGHYFAGKGKLSILKNKSYLGCLVTVITAIIFIPKYKFIGACLTINISHIASSIFLYWHFVKLQRIGINNKQSQLKNDI